MTLSDIRKRLAVVLSLTVCCAVQLASFIPAQAQDSAVEPRSARVNSRVLAQLTSLPAGVAGDEQLVFVGSPLEGRVLVLARASGELVAELPAPPGGFVLPFISHSLETGKLAVLDAGGLPSPDPFVPANPTIYEYSYTYSRKEGFQAELTRSISFASVTIGFAEDFVALPDGRYVLSDAVLGGIWVAQANGTISPGIVPAGPLPEQAIPELAVCPSMPLIEVGGLPFLFSGSTLPGVSPLALRDGQLYFYSPCAEGLYAVPLASLFDARLPHERASDIRLVSAKPDDVAVEQLLALTFNPYDPNDPFLYAADSLQLRVIRIDPSTGEREIIMEDASLLNFPSSMAFLPPRARATRSTLVVVSNQQHRLPLTNEAISEDLTQPPYLVTELRIRPAAVAD